MRATYSETRTMATRVRAAPYLRRMIAKVEPLTPARALRGPFDYRVPSEMEDVEVGSMLVVPFGRRRLVGVVVGLAEDSDVPPARLPQPRPEPRPRAGPAP